jgi:tetratricopeptide (TPR) repeat protein/tRNA A-37 threonylcarbamoyl transferase component Bud32
MIADDDSLIPDLDSTRSLESPDQLAQRTIGRYELVEKVGEGGMGEVWIAKQSEPVKRKVALKLIKQGMDSRSVIARFEQERQALAVMDHPNIAKVLDGGLAENSQPFFVMELVSGRPLVKFCDENKLSIKDRLELFIPICQAVQHAHQKGVIHRDLKPSNILVSTVDGKPVPKVIDFGLAKAVTGKLTDDTLSTHIGAVLGTLEYMAPEQAGVTAEDVDTRADIYSLGVILYELLTGRRPFDLRRVAIDEMIRVIREVDPPSLASRLSTDESLPSTAAVRATEPKRLVSAVKGELDWIARRCLEKDRNRRYETANGLVRDVQRYLTDEPVEARPASAGYRLRKFVARNRGPVIAATLLILALSGGVIGTTWGMLEARRQEGIAKRETDAKEMALETAQANFVQAKVNLAFAKKGNEILGSVFAGLNPEKVAESGRPLQDVLRGHLGRAVNEVDATALGDPLEVAELQEALAVSLSNLGDYDSAAKVHEKAFQARKSILGETHAATQQSMNNLALALRGAGKHVQALPLLEDIHRRLASNEGSESRNLITVMTNLAVALENTQQIDRAMRLHDQAFDLSRSRLGPDHPVTLACMTNLANLLVDGGKHERAIQLLEDAVRLATAKRGPSHPNTLEAMNSLGKAFRVAGKLDLALPILEKTYERRKAELGPDHPSTLLTMNELGLCLQRVGRRKEALELQETALQLQTARFGPDHPTSMSMVSNMATALRDAGRPGEALPLFESAFERRRSNLGADHPDTLFSMDKLAKARLAAGRPDLALPMFEETLKLRRSRLGSDHVDTLASMSNLAAAHMSARNLDRAIPLFEETLNLRKSKLGVDHADTLSSLNNLAAALMHAGKFDRSGQLFEEALRLRRSKSGTSDPETVKLMHNLAANHLAMRNPSKSVAVFEETLKLRESILGRDHVDTVQTVAHLGVAYKDAGRFEEAIRLLEKADDASTKHQSLQWVADHLVDAYQKSGERSKLAKLLMRQIENARRTFPKDSIPLSVAIANASVTMMKLDKFAEAELLLRECLSIRERAQPDAWTTFNIQSSLGAALLGQKKHAEAEPLLLKGYEGMKAREKSIPPQAMSRLYEALDRLIKLYTATNKPDDVKRWTAEREKYPAAKAAPEQSKQASPTKK